MSRKNTPDERERKRVHLLEVAAGEFAQLGFERANINTISEHAGFGKGTVYLYTESKEQLFLDVLQEIGVQTRAVLDESLADSLGLPVPVRLRALAGAFVQLAAEHPDFVRLQASALFGVNRRFQNATATILRQVATQLARTLEDEAAQGTMRPVGAETLALLFVGMLQIFALLPGALGYGTANINAQGDLLVDLFWRGLAPEQGVTGSPR